MGETICGWGGLSENGTTGWDGKAVAGDQTGREVRIDLWYDFGQSQVFRAKDRTLAEQIAKITRALCENDCVGYDQSERWTLNDWLKNNNYAYTKLKTPVECDCSALVLSAINTATHKQTINGGTTTASMRNALMQSGLFDELSGDKYTRTDAFLKIGDIINAPSNHVIVALEDAPNLDESLTLKVVKPHRVGDSLNASDFDVRYRGKNVTGYSVEPLRITKAQTYLNVSWDGNRNVFLYDVTSGKTTQVNAENKVAESPIVYPDSMRPWCLVTSGTNINVYTSPDKMDLMENYPHLASTNGVTLCGQTMDATMSYVYVAEKWFGWVDSARLVDNKTKQRPSILQKISAPTKSENYVAEVSESGVIAVRTSPSASAPIVVAHPYLGNGNLVDVCGKDATSTWCYINVVGVKGWGKSSSLRKR